MMKNSMKQVSLLVCLATLSGCVGSTTYGTGKSQNQNLLEDLSTLVKPRKSKTGSINYADRPNLIKPKNVSQLPEPVQSGAVNDGNWVEAPEVRRARIRGEAEVVDPKTGFLSVKERTRKKRGAKVAYGPGKQNTRSLVGADSSYLSPEDLRKQSAVYRKKQEAIKGVDVGTSTAERKYLTEPKIEYRTPSETAPIGDIGEDEAVKAKRLKGEKGFFDFLKPSK